MIALCLMRKKHACDLHDLVPVALANGLIGQLLEEWQLLQEIVDCPLAVYICLPLPQRLCKHMKESASISCLALLPPSLCRVPTVLLCVCR